MNNNTEILRKKLIYRSQYRGTKEMDKLIGSFVKNYIDLFDSKDLMILEKFLDIDDQTLYKFYNNEITETKILDNKISKLFKEFVNIK
jgi:antitoxin CptB